MNVLKKIPVREQDPRGRTTNFREVCLGYSREEAQEGAQHCINCKNAEYIQGCPVAISISRFISEVKEEKFEDTTNTIAEFNALPAVCGRVYPQKSQYEGKCTCDVKGEPIPIGKLERSVTDWSKEHGFVPAEPDKTNGMKVAIISFGPARLTCAGDLAKIGHEVTIFEALHEPGDVLAYGVPEFRLLRSGVVQPGIGNVRKLGVKIKINIIIGKSVTINGLVDEEGFKAIFVGSGTGLPKFTGIPGENASGAFPANEYLTRNNLMKAFRDDYDTSVYLGKRVVVVGGGNVAINAARTTLCLSAKVHIAYRRSEAELLVRVGGVHHAKKEGIIFNLLTNSVEVLTDDSGWVEGMVVRKMELGEPDASGRCKPVEIAGSDYTTDVDAVIMSLGTSPNPLISSTTEGLETNRWGCIIAGEPNGKTTKEDVHVGEDAVTGAATVTLTMGVGRAGARGIDEFPHGSK